MSAFKDPRVGTIYSRLETDEELAERVYRVTGWRIGYTGDALDTYAWDRCRFQRKIIEDGAK